MVNKTLFIFTNTQLNNYGFVAAPALLSCVYKTIKGIILVLCYVFNTSNVKIIRLTN